MRTFVLVSALALLSSLAPVASASHSTCGPTDGSLGGVLYLWLEPGCVGAVAVVPDCLGTVILHADVLVNGAYVLVTFCGAGVWLP